MNRKYSGSRRFCTTLSVINWEWLEQLAKAGNRSVAETLNRVLDEARKEEGADPNPLGPLLRP